MPRYVHEDVLVNGLAYIKNSCDKVILMSGFTTVYAEASAPLRVAEAAITSPDIGLSYDNTGVPYGIDAILMFYLTGKSGGIAAQTVASPADMHLAFVDTVTGRVLYVTEESGGAVVNAGDLIQFTNDPTYRSKQPTA